MKARFDNLLCVDASGFIHSYRAYDKNWDFQTRVIWLRVNGIGPDEISKMFDLNVNTLKNREFLGLLTLDYKDKNYKLRNVIMSVETKVKYEKIHESLQWLEGQKLNSQKLACDPGWIRKQKDVLNKYWEDPLAREKQSERKKKYFENITNREKHSAAIQHVPYDEWEGYVSDSPYCPLFNEECKESNREKYGRKCFLTGLPEEKNITSTGKQQHLSVHHVDMDKGQGCDGKRWKLVPLCMNWHSKVHNELWEIRIIWLLNNVWG